MKNDEEEFLMLLINLQKRRAPLKRNDGTDDVPSNAESVKMTTSILIRKPSELSRKMLMCNLGRGEKKIFEKLKNIL